MQSIQVTQVRERFEERVCSYNDRHQNLGHLMSWTHFALLCLDIKSLRHQQFSMLQGLSYFDVSWNSRWWREAVAQQTIFCAQRLLQTGLEPEVELLIDARLHLDDEFRDILDWIEESEASEAEFISGGEDYALKCLRLLTKLTYPDHLEVEHNDLVDATNAYAEAHVAKVLPGRRADGLYDRHRLIFINQFLKNAHRNLLG